MTALDEYINGGTHTVAEYTSCFCKFYVSFEQRNMPVQGLTVLLLKLVAAESFTLSCRK